MPILPELTEIKRLRDKLDINQSELERDLKIPQATISRIERGIGNPSYQTVKKIFDYLEQKRIEKKKSEKQAADIMTHPIIDIDCKSSVKDAINLMNEFKISQIPISSEINYIGSITAKKIQKEIMDHPELLNAEIQLIKELPFPEIEYNWNIKNISNLLLTYPAILVKKDGKYIGIITDADFLKLA